jgi:hypothetical protein
MAIDLCKKKVMTIIEFTHYFSSDQECKSHFKIQKEL